MAQRPPKSGPSRRSNPAFCNVLMIFCVALCDRPNSFATFAAEYSGCLIRQSRVATMFRRASDRIALVKKESIIASTRIILCALSAPVCLLSAPVCAFSAPVCLLSAPACALSAVSAFLATSSAFLATSSASSAMPNFSGGMPSDYCLMTYTYLPTARHVLCPSADTSEVWIS